MRLFRVDPFEVTARHFLAHFGLTCVVVFVVVTLLDDCDTSFRHYRPNGLCKIKCCLGGFRGDSDAAITTWKTKWSRTANNTHSQHPHARSTAVLVNGDGTQGGFSIIDSCTADLISVLPTCFENTEKVISLTRKALPTWFKKLSTWQIEFQMKKGKTGANFPTKICSCLPAYSKNANTMKHTEQMRLFCSPFYTIIYNRV